MPNRIRLELTTPADDDRPVFVAGNFTNWFPDVEQFRMNATKPGHFEFAFPQDLPLPDVLEYKYTRGGWDTVELNEAGEAPPNRTTRRKAGKKHDFVPHWRSFGKPFDPNFLPQTIEIDPEIAVSALGRPRRVRVLLPYNYQQTNRHYPVLYLQDGQNLIGAGEGYGSWEIDRKLAILAARNHHEVIVVAINHGDETRIADFTMEQTMAGTGSGQYYLDFLVRDLKPLIDSQFRTLADAQNTGIGGSSLGGLISLYGGLRYPDVFGRLMVFSPSVWIARNIYDEAQAYRPNQKTRIYVFGGTKESRYMAANLKRLSDALQTRWAFFSSGRVLVNLSILPDGRHQEIFWGREFPRAFEWLFYSEK
jgi:predicted alpha/beta superfamily hydrolase